MKVALVISFLIIFILIHILIGQLDDLCEYEKKINKAIEYIEERIERVEDISWVEMKTEDYLEEQQEILGILKGEEKKWRDYIDTK